MKNTFIGLFTFVGFLAFGQESYIEQIDNVVSSIDADSTLVVTEFDWTELTGITTDGGGIQKIWQNNKQICKIVEEVGFSYGRLRTTIYLKNGVPIKIIETEENFGQADGELNDKELIEVYQEIIYVLDWENDNAIINRTGKRNMSEMSCSTFELAEPVLERAEKASAK